MSVKRAVWSILSITLVFVVLAAACGPAAEPTPFPTPTRPLRPTFTPTPLATATPTAMPPTPTPAETPTPIPTVTPSEPPTATPEPPTPAAKPVAVVSGSAQVNVRAGPGTAYTQVGSVPRGVEVEIVGRNAAGDWWQVCCVNGQQVWIVARLVTARNAEAVPVAVNIPTPPPQPTRPPAPPPQPTQPPAPQPTPAPAFRFVKHQMEMRPNSNSIVSIFAGLYNRSLDLSKPVTNYKLVVQAPSGERKEMEFGPFFLRGDPGLPGEFLYNAKIEFPLAEGTYRAWVADPGGNQVAEAYDLPVAGETRTFLPRWKEQ